VNPELGLLQRDYDVKKSDRVTYVNVKLGCEMHTLMGYLQLYKGDR